MEAMRRAIKLTIIALLVACTTLVAYVAGYGTGLDVQRLPEPAPASADETAPLSPDLPESTGGESGLEDESLRDLERPAAFDVFWESWHILQNSYYGELPDEAGMTYGAIRGVLETLGDEHTGLLDPEQAKTWSSGIHGTFEGIGALVDTWPEGGVLIVEPFPEQPAWEAGLRSGDVIVAVDGVDVTEITLQEAILLIRGESGTSVRLSVVRPNESLPFQVEVTRSRILVPVVRSAMLEEGLAYVRLSEFTPQAPDELEAELAALLENQPTGLILDLRSNPGGLLSSAVEVGGLFVRGDIVIQRDQEGQEHHLQAGRAPIIGSLPLAVLINGGTASASEIVAGAIQDNERGVLVGEQTFGKGSVQTPYTLTDGSLLRVTTALWFTPVGRAIHEEGLVPDVLVELRQEDVDSQGDSQLERAIEILISPTPSDFTEATSDATHAGA